MNRSRCYSRPPPQPPLSTSLRMPAQTARRTRLAGSGSIVANRAAILRLLASVQRIEGFTT